MPSSNVKIVVYVPESHADSVREAMGKVGAGMIGNYSFCSFSVKGEGRFKPEAGANPFIGAVGAVEVVSEDRIEITCTRQNLKMVLAAMKAAHPYEEVAFDVYALEDLE